VVEQPGGANAGFSRLSHVEGSAIHALVQWLGQEIGHNWLGPVQSRMVVKVGPFCRKGLSPQGELSLQFVEDCRRHSIIACADVAASRQVLPGRQDLPKYATAPGSVRRLATPLKLPQLGNREDSDRLREDSHGEPTIGVGPWWSPQILQ
jgi:hypothetical protein